MIVVDTSVWIDYFNGVATPQTSRLDSIVGRERIVVGDLIAAEVLQGFRTESDVSTVSDLFGRFERRDMAGWPVALAAARNFRLMRRAGVTVRKTIDVLIATYCVEHGHALLHADRDFDAMEHHLGLMVVAATN